MNDMVIALVVIISGSEWAHEAKLPVSHFGQELNILLWNLQIQRA